MRAWYAFYPKDFMIDTMHLSLEEDCLYRRMIDLYYMEGGPLEDNHPIIAKKLRLNPKVFRRLFPSLQNYFQLKNGFLYHKRIDDELKKSKEIQEHRAEAGRKGGKANAKQLLEPETSNSLSMPQPQPQSRPQKSVTENILSSNLDIAKEIINYLNKKTGRAYLPVQSNTKLILARLKEGHIADDIKQVVDLKVAEWSGTDFDKYLRPATLFNAEKFNQYVGERKTKPRAEKLL